MRLPHVAALVRMFFVYFLRRVLSYGPLKHRGARFGLIALATSTGVVMSFGAYQFLEGLLKPESLELIAQLSSVSTVFWTLVIFLFIKILFMKSDKLLQFTLQLPTGHRERTAALMVYEATMVLGAAMVVFLPLSVALLALLGWSSLPYLASGLAIPAILVYLLVSLLYNLTMMLMLRGGLGRHAHLLTAVMVTVAIFAYNASFPKLVQKISADHFKAEAPHHYVDVFTYTFTHHVACLPTVRRCVALACGGVFATSVPGGPQVLEHADSLAAVRGLAVLRRTHPSLGELGDGRRGLCLRIDAVSDRRQ